MKPLHKNSGRYAREFNVFGRLVFLLVAEDPDKPFLLRRWSTDKETEAAVTRETDLFSVTRIEMEWKDHQFTSDSWRFTLGPFVLYVEAK